MFRIALFCGLLAALAPLMGCGSRTAKPAPTNAEADSLAVEGKHDAASAGDATTLIDTGVGTTCPPPPAAPHIARARKLGCAADLPTGTMAAARVGDVVLENHLVRFVIRTGPTGSATLGLVGGNVVDAVRINSKGQQVGGDALREWIPILGFHLVKPEKVEILADGSTGEARVRVSGSLVPFQTVYAFLQMDKPNLTVSHEYVLKPDTSALEIRTTATPTDGKKDSSLIGDVTFWSGELGLYRPGSGAPDSPFSPASKATSLGLTPMRADATLMPCALGFAGSVSIIDASGILAFLQNGSGGVPVEGRTFVRRLVVGGDGVNGDGVPSVASAMATAGALAGLKYGVLAGKVSDAWPGVEVELMNAGGKPLTRCPVAPDGAYQCPAPVETAGARAIWVGNGAGQGGGHGQAAAIVATKVTEGATTTLALQAPVPARLKVKVRGVEKTGGAAKKIAFQARLDPTQQGSTAGSRTFVDGDGDATFALPPGEWQVWLNHGPEWSVHGEQVTLEAGKTVTIDTTLQHVMKTPGWIACDMHVHAEHSIDSEVPNRERVLDAIAVGLDYVVATDHDYVTDYQPWLKAAGLVGRITVASGVEVSTAKYGHHNVWPITPDPDASGNGAPSWHNKDAPALAKLLRGDAPSRVWQCNHPRGSQSYFKGIDFDPKKAGATDKKLLGFDSVELINSKRTGDTPKVLVDWFSLLDEGVSPTGVGNSDAHSLSAGVGTARTWVWVGMAKDGEQGRDRQGVFSAAEADAAVKAGRAVATTGPLLTLELHNGDKVARIGDTLVGATGDVEARVQVMAPEWMPLGIVEIYHNGQLVKTQPASDAPAKAGLRSLSISVKAAAYQKGDTPAGVKGWWSAMLKPGKAAPTPLVSRPVWAIANPVFEM